MATTRDILVEVNTTPILILQANQWRSSYRILNQDPALAIYICSGTSGGPHVAVAGNHEGERVGPNGGQVYDNDDKDEVWAVAPALNTHIKVFETIKSFHTVKEGKRA